LKIKDIHRYKGKATYQNINTGNVGAQSCSLLTGVLQYLAKNMALLVQKLWGGKSCQSPFPVKTKTFF